VLLGGNGSRPQCFHAQQLRRDPVALEILNAQSTFRRFSSERAEYQRVRERERLLIPGYNVELSHAVAAFHQHIQDMHQRHVDCKLCRQHVGRIKHLAKLIESAMK